jgi:predicted amidohydrolase
MNDLKITIIQSNLDWENIDKNLEMFSSKINSIVEPTDLIVLPEMFTTGFSMQPEKLADTMDGRTVQWMKKQATNKNCVITGSFICVENGNYYNRLIWMKPDGSFSVYDKRHLFSMANEHKHYTAGNKKMTEEINGWKICPLICYDLRFPVWSRNTNADKYDVLIYVANWPERRNHPWKTLLLARAIENQCYVVGVNRIGNDGNEIYHSGDSAVINFKGEIISKTPAHDESVETITLQHNDLEEFRTQFPVLNDADGFHLSS